MTFVLMQILGVAATTVTLAYFDLPNIGFIILYFFICGGF